MAATARRLESQFLLPSASSRVAVPLLVPALPAVDSAGSETLKALKGTRGIVTGAELIEALERKRRNEVVPTTLDAVDRLLNGGLPRGKITEIAGRGARLSIAIAALASSTSTGEAAALIDLGDAFDPQLGESAGIDLHRMLWVRPKNLKQAVAAAEMLIATGFQLVVLDAGIPPLRGRVPDAAWVRLARAAEAHGAALLISSPYPLTGTTSEAMLRAEAPRANWRGGLLAGVDAMLRLEKHRHKRAGESARVRFETLESLAAESFAVRGSPFAESFAVRSSQFADSFAVGRLSLAAESFAVRGSQFAVDASEVADRSRVEKNEPKKSESPVRRPIDASANCELRTANSADATANRELRTANSATATELRAAP